MRKFLLTAAALILTTATISFSTVYGHPAKPRVGPSFPKQLQSVERMNFGLTFENEIQVVVELTPELSEEPRSATKGTDWTDSIFPIHDTE